MSGISTSNPNIASILSTPPTRETKQITAVGSIRTVRKQSNITFIELEDGSTPDSLKALVFKKILAANLGTGVSVAISGLWQHAPHGAEQRYELQAEEIKILGPSDEKYHSPEYLRKIPHLRLRTPLNAVLARMRSEADYHLNRFFRNQQFVRLQPPVITSSDCEGAGEVFDVSVNPSIQRNKNDPSECGQFFRTQKHLTVSSQLHLEAFVHEHPRVWTLSPTFRAEKSETPRHVSEFWMVEAEARTERLQDVMQLVEDMVRALVVGLKNSSILDDIAVATKKGRPADAVTQNYHTENMTSLRQRWEDLLRPSWPRIRYGDAITRLQDAFKEDNVIFEYKPLWENGLQLEHEKWIASEIGQGGPVFVTHYPKETKAFYMLPSAQGQQSDDPTRQTVACFDLLLPEVAEVVGGSLREHRLEYLHQAMQERGINKPEQDPVKIKTNRVARGDATKTFSFNRNDGADQSDATPSAEPGNLDWYVDLRRYGSVPHGGFGLGFDRLLGYLAGINNIKDIVPWPRYYGRCDC
ncbi:MAG: hypothetical protein Q9164_003729 [Protoblastenia rupestris]